MTIVLFTAAVTLLIVALALQHLAEVAASRFSEALRQEAEDRKDILENVMSSTHHEMSREMMLLAFAIDDLADEGVDTAELEQSLHHLESARDAIAVLSQIGGTDSKVYLKLVRADELVPKTTMKFEAITLNPIAADPVLLRAAVAAGAHYYGQTLGMDRMSIVVDRNTIQMDAHVDGSRSVPEARRDGTLGYVNRIVRAHAGHLEIEKLATGWRCTAILPDEPEGIVHANVAPFDSRPPGPGRTKNTSLVPELWKGLFASQS